MTDTSASSSKALVSRTVLQVTAMVSLVSALFQFITAGQILSDQPAAHWLHGDGRSLSMW